MFVYSTAVEVLAKTQLTRTATDFRLTLLSDLVGDSDIGSEDQLGGFESNWGALN
jgi:hypothetical protein